MCLSVKSVPAKVKGSVTEVTNKLSLSSHILHHCKLKEANKCKDLESSSNRNLQGASPAFSNVRELGSVVRNITGKTETSTGGDLSKEGKLADTSVLDLDVTEAVESLLVGTIQQAEGIEESKRGLGTELVLEGSKGGGGLAGLGRGEVANDNSRRDGRLLRMHARRQTGESRREKSPAAGRLVVRWPGQNSGRVLTS